MAGVLSNGGAFVGTVRVRYTTSDPLSAELRAGSLVRTTNLDVPGLPPAAILCVRRLADPLPGRIRLERWQQAAPREWNGAVTDALVTTFRTAARPALGPVPDQAEAVWFADRAELLAALAIDWAVDAVGRRWWWRNLVGPGDSSTVFGQWESAPEYVPGAVEILTARHLAIEVIRRVPGAVAERILDRVLAAHAVSLPIRNQSEPAAPETQAPRIEARTVPILEEPPWRGWAGETARAVLAPRQEALLALALMLHREPGRVRSASFARAYVEWWSSSRSLAQVTPQASARLTQVTEPEHAAGTSTSASAPALEIAAKVRAAPYLELPESDALPAAEALAPEVARLDQCTTAKESVAEVPRAGADVDGEPAPMVKAGLDLLPEPQRGEVAKRPRPAPLESESPNPDAGVLSTTVPFEMPLTPTEFGGLFFVLNAALALRLYADFASPGGPNLDISPWDLLALAGGRWCGKSFRSDPIWALLAELAGRDVNEEPADGLPPADDTIDTLAGWLAPALDMEPERAPGFLVQIPAKIRTTLTHVDAFYSLQQHPIEIRCSGLDRNPGWIPAAGRYVAFHFD